MIPSPIVSFVLNVDELEEMSEVVFGGLPDQSMIKDDWVEVPLVKSQDTWWTVRLQGMKLGDVAVSTTVINYAIADTGTSLLYIARSHYTAFARMI